eukprot:gene17455-biopygen21880
MFEIPTVTASLGAVERYHCGATQAAAASRHNCASAGGGGCPALLLLRYCHRRSHPRPPQRVAERHCGAAKLVPLAYVADLGGCDQRSYHAAGRRPR